MLDLQHCVFTGDADSVKLVQKKNVDMGTDSLGMKIAVDWDIKPQTMQKTTAYSLACMITRTHARTHAVSEINSSILNCRRVFISLLYLDLYVLGDDALIS